MERKLGLWDQSPVADFYSASPPGTHLLSSQTRPPPNMLSQAQNNEPSLATQPLLLYTTFTEPGASVQSTHIVLSPEQC